MVEIKKTPFLDMNNRRIMKRKVGRKTKFFVRKLDKKTGKFKKVVRKAHLRKNGMNAPVTNIATITTVPVAIRKKSMSTNLLKNNTNNKVLRNETTMDGLNHWHKHLFEHLGWMILAKVKGYGYKVKMYKRSIADFLRAAEQAFSDFEYSNRKRDIKIMYKQVKVLRTFAKHL
jgi:hypothetical protein